MRALSRTNYNRLKLKALGDWNEFTLVKWLVARPKAATFAIDGKTDMPLRQTVDE